MHPAEDHPPRPLPGLTIGITGHRTLSPDTLARVTGALNGVFGRIEASSAGAVTLISQLAEGVDQAAAEAALAHGFTLQAMLPCPLDLFRRDFAPAAQMRLDALVARATAVWVPPPTHAAAHPVAGEAMVAQADLVIAVWDGAAARRPGATADIVADAVRRGVPVVHLSTVDDAAVLLWAGFDGLSPWLVGRDGAPRRPLDSAAFDQVLDHLAATPPPGRELDALTQYLAERERRLHVRPEWALLQALAGVRALGRQSVRSDPYLAASARYWASFRAGVGQRCAGLDVLERAFTWADGLADYYATIYRSGTVLNYAGAALAVLLALAAIVVPNIKLPLLVGELAVIAAVIANTMVGTLRGWHRRWLDYRYLAEQLRPMRSLKLLGMARPPWGGRGLEPRWTDRYADATWRAMGAPPTIADGTALAILARGIAEHEVRAQVAYHHAAAHRLHALDHRLHHIGLALFVATIGVGLVALAGIAFKVGAIVAALPLIGVISAALPTVGAAIFGIRGAGDFAGVAGRSAETETRLAGLAKLLERDGAELPAIARATEEAAATMLSELAEWRATYRHRKLAIPS